MSVGIERREVDCYNVALVHAASKMKTEKFTSIAAFCWQEKSELLATCNR